MYINKLIKKQVMLILATVVLVGTLAVTTSFAVFEETKSNATDQKMTIGNLDVTYTGGAAISITDINPMTDSTALSKTNNIYTFTIKNTGTVPYNFKVKVINNPSYTSNLLPHQYIRYSLNNGTASTLGSGQADYELTSGVIEAGATNTYNLRLWVADASTYSLPNSVLGQEIHLKISVEGKAGSGWLPSNFKDRILALNEIKTPITTPGTAVSTASEALLASTEDDYGTSYYFRGAVKNNYVQFANKCWRIVRVGGDGSVKLILHNDNKAGVANPCDAANNSASAAFARYSGETYKSAFNTNYWDNAYVGFKYGTLGSSTYEATHANTNKSTILTNLETWYTNNLKTYESVIDNSVWCNDKTNVTDTSYNPWTSYGGNATGLGYGTNKTYYGATQRLVSASKSAGGTGPSLKCNGELSKINSKVGLITADELAYAGYAYAQNNTTTYLQENATDTDWWSLSPGSFDGSDAGVWVVYGSLGSFDYYSVFNAEGVRPSISLKPSTNVTGEGTSSSPFIINM
ncbi:MAG: hypothetical protein DBY43_02300 [Clostridiaceae bacterium]|nr:MAG: hypothetical protein DBY43_02300 [Clostridiaceae bacterium]